MNVDKETLEQIQKMIKETKSRKKIKKMDVILAIVFLATVGIVVAYFYSILVVGIEPTVIVDNWFKVVIVELIVMGGIKGIEDWRGKDD